MRCSDEMIQYLSRVSMIWDYIGEGIPNFLESIDEASVKLLDGQAPARFSEDAEVVMRSIVNQALFPKVAVKENRALILQRLMKIDYRIISLNTFWGDIKSVASFGRIMTDVRV